MLCDVNFFLDIFLERRPFYASAATLFSLIESGKVKGSICSLTFPILFYLLAKETGTAGAVKVLEKIRIVFSVAAVDERVIDLSLASDFRDLEDAVQYYAALESGAICIISRDKGDYPRAKIRVVTSEEFLATHTKL
ncbi:MAG TPA: PIN domain-containing protein [Dissulfurispiraceae bacterium]|nr:PIN domain-containing protein [Dissulfurispiraceae bacterium]